MSTSYPSRDLLSLTILALLSERPMHAYQMQRLIRERRKQFAASKMRALYYAVERLHQAGWIEPEEISRDGKRPERTIYRLTDAGRGEFYAWLKELLTTPVPELPVFTAAVSFLAHLPPGEVLRALQTRSGVLAGEISGIDGALRGLQPQLPRLVLLESEHRRALLQAELEWVQALIEDIQSGALNWDPSLYHWQPGTEGEGENNA